MRKTLPHTFNGGLLMEYNLSYSISLFVILQLLLTDVVNRVRNGESTPYRPALPTSSELGRELLDLIETCWDENPDVRPTMTQIRSSLKKITGGE